MGFLKVFICVFAVYVIAEIFDIWNHKYSRKNDKGEKKEKIKKNTLKERISSLDPKDITLLLMFIALILLLIFKPNI